MPDKPTYVIVVCGPSGCGKSTVIEKLIPRLGSANFLRFDDYAATNIIPDFNEWVEQGGDPNQISTPQLASDMRALWSGKAIMDPNSKVEVKPARFLVVEEIFGRLRNQVRNMIDLVAYIDVPWEIALARQIMRENDFLPWEKNPELFTANLRGFLDWYLNKGRRGYQVAISKVAQDVDIVVDGMLSPERIAEDIYKAVIERTTLENCTDLSC